MTDELRHIISLLGRRLRGDVLSREDAQVLDAWARESAYTAEVEALFSNEAQLEAVLRQRLGEDYTADWLRVRAAIGAWGGQADTKQQARPVHRIPSLAGGRHFLKTAWFKYAAAIIILITGITIYYFSHTSQPQTAMVNPMPPAATGDIAPGYNRAVLTLSNGQKVELDSAASETITDGNVSIRNTDGQLTYSGLSPAGGSGGALSNREQHKDRRDAEGGPISFNTMTTPKGGQYQLTLSDGTKVWLNAASSITYPTSFTGKTREVSITGEAYFEVKANKAKPFIVKTVREDITVLGTSFNVNAYADEGDVKTSLLEGSVKIAAKVLHPGQAFIDGRIVQTNLEQDAAWKNGVFYFNNTDIKTAMRQFERWYDIEVVYKGELPKFDFQGKLPRSLSLNQVLKALNKVGLQSKLEGRKLIVSP